MGMAREYLMTVEKYQMLRSWFNLPAADEAYAADQVTKINAAIVDYISRHPETLETTEN